MSKQYVMTDYTDCRYITAGKVYEMTTGEGTDELIIDDEDSEINILGPDYPDTCSHLDDIGVWYYVDAEGNKL
jgi:hypothetical protein